MKTTVITVIAILLGIAYQVFIDIYLPALPSMSYFFGESSYLLQLSLTVYLLGNGITVIIFGIISDKFGRKNIIVLGIIFCIFGNILSIYSSSIYLFLLSRFLQGLGLGAAIIATPIFMDVLKGRALVVAFMLFEVFYSSVPIFAPFFGGLILKFYDWQAIFHILLLYMIVLLAIILLFLPETLPKNRRSNFSHLSKNIFSVLSNRQFLGLTVIMVCSWGILVVFNVLGPFIFQEIFMIDSYKYGLLTLYIGVVYMIATLINASILIRFFSPFTIILISLMGLLLCSLSFIILSNFYSSSIELCMIITLILSFICGLLFINCMTTSLALFTHISGVAASMQGGLNILMWGVITFFVALFPPSQLLLAISYIILSLISFIIFLYLKLFVKLVIPDSIKH